MLLQKVFLIILLSLSTQNNIPQKKSIFISPVKIPPLLSSNFGELRIDHYHSGIDIKTQGVTGKEVVAAAEGYIYRISISPGGFGNALYLRHPTGYSTVYGHLDKFIPDIEEYITELQYKKKSFSITAFPEKDRFPVRQGDLIAYSGNSGGSAGPHLHYEIRKADNENPLNPLLFEFGLNDNIPPVIEKLAIYPINRNSRINGQNIKKVIGVSGNNGEYSISGANELIVSGLTGFGIKAFDRLDGSTNKCAPYTIELSIDSTEIFKYRMDGFSFSESRFINSHIDYEYYQKNGMYIERTFLLPNDKLSVYNNFVNRGLFNFDDGRIHKCLIVVYDIHNNKSSLSFDIKAQVLEDNEPINPIDQKLKVMPYNRRNTFTSENISISIPSGALYDTLYFDYKKMPGENYMYSDLHQVHNKFTPVQKAFSLSIKPKIVPAGKESKMMIVQLGDDQNKSSVNSIWTEGYLKAEVMSFGNFYIGIDTIAPTILARELVPGINIEGRKELRIKITDDFSGIKSYEPTIDGAWALFEYDPKNNILIYRFDEKRIAKGTIHNLLLEVSDNKDNTSHFNCDFRW